MCPKKFAFFPHARNLFTMSLKRKQSIMFYITYSSNMQPEEVMTDYSWELHIKSASHLNTLYEHMFRENLVQNLRQCLLVSWMHNEKPRYSWAGKNTKTSSKIYQPAQSYLKKDNTNPVSGYLI